MLYYVIIYIYILISLAMALLMQAYEANLIGLWHTVC
jgi:hypothetical protein